jgi:hypothetical protein
MHGGSFSVLGRLYSQCRPRQESCQFVDSSGKLSQLKGKAWPLFQMFRKKYQGLERFISKRPAADLAGHGTHEAC